MTTRSGNRKERDMKEYTLEISPSKGIYLTIYRCRITDATNKENYDGTRD